MSSPLERAKLRVVKHQQEKSKEILKTEKLASKDKQLFKVLVTSDPLAEPATHVEYNRQLPSQQPILIQSEDDQEESRNIKSSKKSKLPRESKSRKSKTKKAEAEEKRKDMEAELEANPPEYRILKAKIESQLPSSLIVRSKWIPTADERIKSVYIILITGKCNSVPS